MTRHTEENFAGGWVQLLDQLEEAVIVLDEERNLRHVNQAARRLLGYEGDQPIGGRCRLTTRGVDCDNACPLTFALENGLKQVQNFATVYHAADGRALPLDITVIPFVGEEGEFLGSAEILRPSTPQPGFFTCGSSDVAVDLRRRAVEIAGRESDLLLVGEGPSCLDVAKTIHRFSELPDELFYVWNGSWDDITPWPGGTVYAYGQADLPELSSGRPEGWRAIFGTSACDGHRDDLVVWELPPLEALSEDLSRMIGTWVEELAPGKSVSADALEQLVLLAGEGGLQGVEEALSTAIAAAADCIGTEHLPVDGHRTALVDELLKTENPLAALEQKVLHEVLERCGWRMQDAAQRLGISRVTLWRKMKDLGIEKNS